MPEKRSNDLNVENISEKSERDLIKNVNQKVLVDVLSPEVSENESVKRIHKYILLLLMTLFLVVQFSSVHIISTIVLGYAVSDGSDIEIIKSLLTFVLTYITSVVAELIVILKYIVKNVFDTSLVDLVKIFKETDVKVNCNE